MRQFYVSAHQQVLTQLTIVTPKGEPREDGAPKRA